MRTTSKPFNIVKMQVYEAYQAVKSNGGFESRCAGYKSRRSAMGKEGQ